MNRKNLGVNFLRRWEFELKFDRDPKEWSFEKLMRLYHSAKERADKRRKDFSDMIVKTIEELEPDEKGYVKAYFHIDDAAYSYNLRKDYEFGWCYSTDRVSFETKDAVLKRDQKIEFLLANQKRFELGQELRRLEKMKSVFDRHVFGIIEEAVNEKLIARFKNAKNQLVPRVIKIDLGGEIYYAALTKESRNSGYDWKAFEILGKAEDEVIML